MVNRPVIPPVIQPPEVTIRWDFKINGQIGERGHRDKLSYTNFIHQIDLAVKNGHSELEIGSFGQSGSQSYQPRTIPPGHAGDKSRSHPLTTPDNSKGPLQGAQLGGFIPSVD